MVVHEFRIALPLSLEEFHRGQLYMTAKVSLEHTKGDEGVEWLFNEPYDNTDGHMGISKYTGIPVPRNKGQYTLKRYLLRSKVPSIVVHLVPANALFLVEEAWNAYPHCKTVLVNGYFDKTRFRIDVETMHLDKLDAENALSLSPEELKHRKVEYLDIRNAHHDPKAKDYDASLDVRNNTSAKTGRGPLLPGWEKDPKVQPKMCAYKLVRAEFRYFGFQSSIENTILSSQRDLFCKTLAKSFSLIDEWVDMSMEAIRTLEHEVAGKANKALEATLKVTSNIDAHSSNSGGAGGAGSDSGAAREPAAALNVSPPG